MVKRGQVAAAVLTVVCSGGISGAAELAGPERFLLTKPGRFVVVVHTEAHPEDRPNANLPFDGQRLAEPVRAALDKRGVPVVLRSDAQPRRTIDLYVSDYRDATGYAYILTLQPGPLPEDPKNVIYDDAPWPMAFGSSEEGGLFEAMVQSIQTLATDFAKLYAEASQKP